MIQARSALEFGWFVAKTLPDNTVIYLVGVDPCRAVVSEWTPDILKATMFPDPSTALMAVREVGVRGTGVLRLSRETR